MSTATLETARPLAPEQLEATLEEFHREGSVIVPGVFSAEECAELRDRADRLYEPLQPTNLFSKMVLREVCALDTAFRDLLIREPILGMAQAILGQDCRYCGSNVIRNGRDEAIDHWHVDLTLEIPLPPDVPRFDTRIRMPVLWMTFQVALTDIDRLEDGPTQFVPGSHYSGRGPAPGENPEFEGRGPVNLTCRAGDVYLTNHQTWHRGSPNRSDRTRYLLQLQYAKAWTIHRFNGYIAPVVERMHEDGEIENADPRLMQVLSTGPNKY